MSMTTIREWTVREQILATAHRWPVPMLAFLAGALLGWGLGFLFPASYQADAAILVGYSADQVMTSPDDYKNWQIEQLNALTGAEDVLAETLARLQGGDAAWAGVTIPDLREKLQANFRSTGEWDLTARDRDAGRAVAAAGTWADVVLENYHQAAGSASAAARLDAQVEAAAAALAGLQARRQQIPLVAAEMDRLEAAIRSVDPQAPLPDLAQWQAWSLLAAAGAPDKAWQGLLNNFPVASPAGEVLGWVEKGRLLVERDQAMLPAQETALAEALAGLEAQRAGAMQASRGLSANLVVERNGAAPIQAVSERPGAVTAAVGGFIGLLLWVFVYLARLGLDRDG